MSETVAHILRGGLGAFQPAVAGVVRDVAVPPLLPTAEQLSDRLCALRMFHPRRVRHLCLLFLAAPDLLARTVPLVVSCFCFALLHNARSRGCGTLLTVALHQYQFLLSM